MALKHLTEKTAPAALAALQRYDRRQKRAEHPEGRFDRGGRFYVAGRDSEVLDSIRSPSRSFPLSENQAARSLAHCERFDEAKHDAVLELKQRLKKREIDVQAPEAKEAVVRWLEREKHGERTVAFENYALHVAARDGDVSGIRQAIDKGAQVNARDVNDNTPLHRAAEYNQEQAVKVLAEDYKADTNAINNRQETPTHLAARSNSAINLRVLKFCGADPERVNEKGLTAMHIAASHGHSEVVKALHEGGGSVNTRTVETGLTPLMVAAKKAHTKTAEVLMGAKADVNAQTEKGNTALHIACMAGHLDTAVALLNGGADTSLKNDRGLTADQVWWPREGISEELKTSQSATFKAAFKAKDLDNKLAHESESWAPPAQATKRGQVQKADGAVLKQAEKKSQSQAQRL